VSLTKKQVENSPDVDSRNFSATTSDPITIIMVGPIIGSVGMYGGQRRQLA
jgi:hypothetical protein